MVRCTFGRTEGRPLLIFTATGKLGSYNQRMKLILLAGLLLSGSITLAQEAVDLAAEPHYRLLLENDQVRVFALTLHPEQSALVHLQRTFMTVALQDGEIIIWDDGKSPIQHFQVHLGETSFRCWSPVCLAPQQLAAGLSGGYRNDCMQDYRNITVEFLDSQIGWSMPEGGLLGPPGSMFVGGAIIADVLLQPGETFPAPQKEGAELLIPLSDLNLKSVRKGHVRESPGKVAWLREGEVGALFDAGRDPARFIVVEFQPDTPFAPISQ
jgi:hypothetical protein